MVIKVGINGFGRIGRIVSRACLQNSELQLSAINDPAISVEYVCYLIKFDSTHGKLKGNITHTDDEILIDGYRIKVFHEKLPPSVPWRSAGVQYVVEASGMFTNYEKASGHLKSDGVKRVIVTAPSVDVPMIVLGVNDNNFSPERKVISCASSTLYCLAPIIKVLEDRFGVEEGFITSIHAMTPSLKPLDGLCLRGKHWRDHRSIHQNIIPATTGACKALGKILPQVKDKLSGLAFRVPIVNVSVLDLTIRLRTHTTLQDIVKSVEQASKSTLRNIIKVSSEESVSSDFIGESHSCIFDEDSSIQLKPNFFKIICWYENEYTYACRVLDTITFSEKQDCTKILTKMTNVMQKSPNKQNVVQQTESFKKDMCLCGKAKLNSGIISSISQDTGVKILSPPHHLLTKKPLSATTPTLMTYKDTKRNELLKIWNDTSENSRQNTKQNRCSFFQSCMGSQLQPTKDLECNTQERLETVKREFSKMVNITEDLLKKTYTNQSNARLISESIDKIKRVNNPNLKAKDPINVDTEDCKKAEYHSSTEEYGDCKSFLDFSTNSQAQNNSSRVEAVSLVSYDKLKSDYSDFNRNRVSKHIMDMTELGKEFNKNKATTDKLTSKKFNTDSNNEIMAIPNETYQYKQQLTKTINTLVDGLNKNVQVRCVWNNNNIKTTTAAENEKIANTTNDDKNKDLPKLDCRQLTFEKYNKIAPEINNFDVRDKIAHDINQYKVKPEKSNIKVIDEELRKRNIILVDSSIVAETETELCNHENDNFITETSKDIRSTEQNIEVSPYTPYEDAIISEETSKCATPERTVTSITNIPYGNRQDIYDKLDSASGSESNNSFDINERKSQVLQITDLTNSLEDLARLDKICRIIEISDELSDKLFSALDDNNGTEIKKKRWSFKDLCVRIKLDEFCNKVFGGTTV